MRENNCLWSIVYSLWLSMLVFTGAQAQDIEWKELTSEHFLIYHQQSEKFAREVATKAESYYRQIASDLGYPRYSNFWTWDNRAKIYIYPDHASYVAATGQPNWSHGMADYFKKTIISYAWSQGFTESLLPHEMAHLIFRDFVGFKGEIPLWLDEGVAQWAEKPKHEFMKQKVKDIYEKDGLLRVGDVMKMDLSSFSDPKKPYIRPSLTKDNKPAVLILGAENIIDLYYIQGFSLVAYLIERHGSFSFAQFCRELRDGKSLEAALRAAYPSHLREIKELEEKWRQYLAEYK